jgi:hypothetical protein
MAGVLAINLLPSLFFPPYCLYAYDLGREV